MAGLLGFMAAGAAKGYAAGRGQELAQEKEFNLKLALQDAQMEKEMRLKEAGYDMQEKYDQKKEKRVRQANIDDMADIKKNAELNLATSSLKGLGTAGVGGSVDAESLQALKDNPEALEAYRKAGATGLLNSSRQDEAEAYANESLMKGRTDLADKYENVAKGERADTKEENRYKEATERADRAEQNAERRFMLQMAANERAMKSASAREESAENRARLSALSDSLKIYQDNSKQAMVELSKMEVQGDEKLTKYFKDMQETNMVKAQEIANRLESYALEKSFDVKQTPVDESNPLGIPAELLNGKTTEQKSETKQTTSEASASETPQRKEKVTQKPSIKSSNDWRNKLTEMNSWDLDRTLKNYKNQLKFPGVKEQVDYIEALIKAREASNRISIK